jgi:hypothetical protein
LRKKGKQGKGYYIVSTGNTTQGSGGGSEIPSPKNGGSLQAVMPDNSPKIVNNNSAVVSESNNSAAHHGVDTPSKFNSSHDVSPSRSSVSITPATQAQDSQSEVLQVLREDAFKFLCSNQRQHYVYDAPPPSHGVGENGSESKFVKFFSGTWAGGGDFQSAADNNNNDALSYSSVGSGK